MSTYLVVANQTLPSPVLRQAVVDRLSEGSVNFYVVVPATPLGKGFTWDEEEARRQAGERLAVFLDGLRELGAEGSGEVGDRDPVQAVRDALRERTVDEIILSTLPPGISRWLGQDVPSRLRGAVPVPVSVVYEESPAATAQT